jgi:hypothetical protein
VRLLRGALARSRRLSRFLRARALVLVYHRVATADVDPWDLAVRPEHFDEHLKVLKRCSTLLSLSELIRSIEIGRVPRRGIRTPSPPGLSHVEKLPRSLRMGW